MYQVVSIMNRGFALLNCSTKGLPFSETSSSLDLPGLVVYYSVLLTLAAYYGGNLAAACGESLNHFGTKKVCACVCVCVCGHVCTYVYIYMWIIHIHMCVCVCLIFLLGFSKDLPYYVVRMFSQARLQKMNQTLCPLNVTKSIDHCLYHSPSIYINRSMYLLSYQYVYQ